MKKCKNTSFVFLISVGHNMRRAKSSYGVLESLRINCPKHSYLKAGSISRPTTAALQRLHRGNKKGNDREGRSRVRVSFSTRPKSALRPKSGICFVASELDIINLINQWV